MVPSLERAEYMYELRGIAENIVIERVKQSEVGLPTHTEGVRGVKEPEAADNIEPVLVAHPGKGFPSVQDGPAFHIPMTQEKELEDLPSQPGFDCQDSVTPSQSGAPSTARRLGEELDVVSTPHIGSQPAHVNVDAFVEVSQIAREAVMDAAPVELPQPASTTTTGQADA